MLSKKTDYERALIGSIVHAVAVFYFFVYPLVLFIVFLVDQEAVPETLASFSWITYLNFALMIFYAAVLGFGLMRPLKRWIRMIVGGLFGLSVLMNAIGFIVMLAMFDKAMDTIPTILNTLFLALLAVGLFLGYESKAAPYLMPFRAVEDPDSPGIGSSSGGGISFQAD